MYLFFTGTLLSLSYASNIWSIITIRRTHVEIDCKINVAEIKSDSPRDSRAYSDQTKSPLKYERHQCHSRVACH